MRRLSASTRLRHPGRCLPLSTLFRYVRCRPYCLANALWPPALFTRERINSTRSSASSTRTGGFSYSVAVIASDEGAGRSVYSNFHCFACRRHDGCPSPRRVSARRAGSSATKLLQFPRRVERVPCLPMGQERPIYGGNALSASPLIDGVIGLRACG
jgi:hypothetical protein